MNKKSILFFLFLLVIPFSLSIGTTLYDYRDSFSSCTERTFTGTESYIVPRCNYTLLGITYNITDLNWSHYPSNIRASDSTIPKQNYSYVNVTINLTNSKIYNFVQVHGWKDEGYFDTPRIDILDQNGNNVGVWLNTYSDTTYVYNIPIKQQNYTQFQMLFHANPLLSTYTISAFHINITYTNDTNTLPIMNLETNENVYCYNTSTILEGVNIPINVNAYDYQSDTIYYSLTSGTSVNESTYIDFREYTQELEDYYFYYNARYEDSYCNFSYTESNDYYTKIIDYEDENDEIDRMLYLDSRCSEPSAIDFDFPSYKNIETIVDIYGNDNINESYSILLYDTYKLVPLFNATIYINQTTSSKYLELNGIYKGTFTRTGNYDILIQLPNRYENYIEITLKNDTTNILNVNTTLNNNNNQTFPEVFTIRDNNGIVMINNIHFLGIYDKIDWTTTEPTSITTSKIGPIPIKVYVTDNEHLNTNEYIYDTIILNVLNENYPVCLYLTDNSLKNTTDLVIGNEWLSYYTNLGYLDELKVFINILFIFLTISFSVFFYKIRYSLEVSLSIFLSSMICLVTSLISQFTSSALSYLIISCISGAILLFKGKG